jgi:hypothetical protein
MMLSRASRRTLSIAPSASIRRTLTSLTDNPNGDPRDGTYPPLKLNYFALWARGPSVALALAHSGVPWRAGADYGNETHHMGEYATRWQGRDKQTNTFGHLPTLEVPGSATIGHEHAILTFIGRIVPEMAGSCIAEEVTSLQLMCEGEDIYRKLGDTRTFCHTLHSPNFLGDNLKTLSNDPGLTAEQLEQFWKGSNATEHNKQFGISDHLDHIEKFHSLCDTSSDGKFTSSGTTVGECKLFTNLHSCVMARPACLEAHPAVEKFYLAFLELEQTQDIVKTGGKMKRPFEQYFS